MAKTGANPLASTPPASRSLIGRRFLLLFAGIVLALAFTAIGYLLASQSRGKGVAAWYTDVAGTEIKEGDPNSPMGVIVRLPNEELSKGYILALSLQLIDESGQPARYGSSEVSSFTMTPGRELDLWEHRGSLPTAPGVYHARLQVQRSASPTEVQTIDLPQYRVKVNPESGVPLASGFVFNRGDNLWIATTDATRQRRLTFFVPPGEYGAEPAWSPDGKSIAFAYLPKSESADLPRTGIWSINPDGTGLKQLAAPGPDEILIEPAWAPDGRTIYFSVDRMSNDPLPNGATKADTDKYRRIDSVNLATGVRSQVVLGAQFPASIASDGKMLFLEDVAPANPGDSPSQQLVRGDGKSAPLVLVKPYSFPQMSAPALSPDGKWVVFAAPNGSPGDGRLDFFQWLVFAPQTAYAHSLPWDLFIVPASGGEYARLTTLNEDLPSPLWLNNSTIAFLGQSGLYNLTIDASGKPVGNPTSLTVGSYHGQLTWHAP